MADTWQDRLGRYFDLRLPRRRDPGAAQAVDGAVAAALPAWTVEDVGWIAAIYLIQVLGVVAKQVFDVSDAGQPLSVTFQSLLIAFIVSAVTFPATYGSLRGERSPALRLFLAFQSGFFWRSVLAGISSL